MLYFSTAPNQWFCTTLRSRKPGNCGLLLKCCFATVQRVTSRFIQPYWLSHSSLTLPYNPINLVVSGLSRGLLDGYSSRKKWSWEFRRSTCTMYHCTAYDVYVIAI